MLIAESEPPGIIGAGHKGFDQWNTCMDCHNKARYEDGKEHFPHKLHFEEEDVDDNCESCHESVIHEKITTDTSGCYKKCHDEDEFGLEKAE
jgi:formate-dependent nitrite reductase cytochrome c552 subunit